MELDQAIRRRRMCRNFLAEGVPPEVVDRLIDRARRAPSAGHSQGWAFLTLSGPEETGRFWGATSDRAWLDDPSFAGLRRAALVIVPFCSPAAYVARYSEPDKVAHGLTTMEAWPVPFWTVDVSFATMLLLLGVVEEGLGALFFGFQSRKVIAAVRAVFGVPSAFEPIGAVAVGWPADDWGPRGSSARGRRSVEEVVHRGNWDAGRIGSGRHERGQHLTD
jgi:nitroreductase